VTRKAQLENGRWLALVCVVLLLIFTAVEATHAHSEAALGSSSSCALCVSVHANALPITVHSLPSPLVVEVVPISFHTEVRGLTRELSIFIRPPPSPSA
jgi:hypothetical protein